MRRGLFALLFVAIIAGDRSPQAKPAAPAPGGTPSIVTLPVPSTAVGVEERRVSSPSGSIEVIFRLTDGVPIYTILYQGRPVILPSRLGLVLKEDASLNGNFTIIDSKERTHDEIWTQPWGEVKTIRDHYNELQVDLQQTRGAGRLMRLVFRAHDDGVGFRYVVPEQPGLSAFEITNEETQFVLAGDHTAWWIPAHEDNRYEYLYSTTPVSEMDVVHTPLTMRTDDGLYLSLHEAALTDYPSMTLLREGRYTLVSDLVPWPDGVKVKTEVPMQSPWRTLQIAETPGDLITSYLILNLNEPNVLEDTSWIRPMKYIGIWWGMHINKYTWSEGPRHGATTENARRYIDFAAEHGIDAVLIEGWNVGWDGDWTHHGERFSFTEPYPDFDLEGVAGYAAERGVTLMGHHETGGEASNYEQQLTEAFALYQRLGINAVKTGYVGWPEGVRRADEDSDQMALESHHGQWMVQHYRRVVEAAAEAKITLNVHEPVKPTGIRRTYPNMMTREGARGQEYNAWSADGGNPPDHTTILPFTRLLAGPMDFTPGIFDLTFEELRADNRVNTTLAKQLALYVVIYSPLQMAADLPENYEGHPAFQFIVDVPVDWEKTLVLNGEIGDFVTIVRQERDGDEWYLGSITDEEARTLTVRLDFLEPGRVYVAEIYADGPDAHWDTNPYPVEITEALVSWETLMQLDLAAGGGQAIRFRPAEEDDIMRLSSD